MVYIIRTKDRVIIYVIVFNVDIYLHLCVDEVDETVQVLLPFLLPQKNAKVMHKEFIRFVFVSLCYLQFVHDN